MATETLSFNTANGETTAYVAMPGQSNGRAVIVIQEWWGLNEHIKDITRRYADEGFTAVIHGKYWHEETRATASQALHAGGGAYLVVLDRAEAATVSDYIRHGGSDAELLRQFEHGVGERRRAHD